MSKDILIPIFAIYVFFANPLITPIMMWSGPGHAFDLWATIALAPGCILWILGVGALIVEHGEDVEKKELEAAQQKSGNPPSTDLNAENHKLRLRIKQLEKELADSIIVGGTQ